MPSWPCRIFHPQQRLWARGSARYQCRWSTRGPEQSPSTTYIVTSARDSPLHQRRLGWPPINVVRSRLRHQRTRSTAPPGAAPVNIARSRLRHQRATQRAGIGSVSHLGRARHPLGRKFHNYGSVVNACVGARHNLPRPKVIQHRSSFYLAMV